MCQTNELVSKCHPLPNRFGHTIPYFEANCEEMNLAKDQTNCIEAWKFISNNIEPPRSLLSYIIIESQHGINTQCNTKWNK